MNHPTIHVLLVEDNEDDYLLTQALFSRIEGERFSLSRAKSHEEALTEILNRRHDVYLVDSMPGEKSALDLLQAVRAAGNNVPFIILTGREERELDLKALQAGVADCLIKSQINPALLKCSIRYALERSRISEALRRSEARYRNFFEEDSAANYIATREGKLLACNPAFSRLFGFSGVDEAMRSGLGALYRDRRAMEAFLDLLKREKKVEYYEAELRRADGSPVHVIENVVAAFAEDGELAEIKGYLLDDTRRTNLERQILKSQKMEAIGRLASGLAHDFNNLLTVVIGHSDLLLMHFGENSKLRFGVEQIRKAGERAASLTDQLLAFGRKQGTQGKVLDLNSMVSGMQTILHQALGERIQLLTDLDPELGRVKADRGELEQVLMNLVLNARDAMSDGGVFKVATANRVLKSAQTRRRSDIQTGAYVMLEVTDTGRGMDAETQVFLFEPFFTTKEKGKGTGLGLFTAYGIVKQAGGDIQVFSEPGSGSTFQIYLPRVEAPLEAVPDASVSEPPSGTERPSSKNRSHPAC